MTTGTVKWFNDYKGFGFLTQDGSEEDVFVHYSGIEGDEDERKTLLENEKVEYDVEDSEKGLIAKNVRKI